MARTVGPRGALVIGGDHQGLGIVRSLGRRGIPVWVLDDEVSISAVSRYTRRRLRWPPDERRQVELLLAIAARHRLGGWAIFPTRDETVALLAREHDRLSACFRLTTPPWPITRQAYDKRLAYRLAAELGIPTPRTAYPTDRAAVEALDLTFPVILKPAIKDPFYRLTRAKAWRVDDRAELLRRYDEAAALVGSDGLMVQDLIPGGGEAQFSFAALCLDGRVRASLVARRARQHPMDFGHASTFVETVERPEVEAAGERFLEAIGYTGLAEVEFKFDRRDGAYRLLDVNARTWGWHTLGRRAGVDFPYLLWQALEGVPLERVRGRPGVRWVRMVTDVPTALGEIRRGRLAVRDYLASIRPPIEFSVLAPDDPLPVVAELALLPYLLWKRGF
ncbi:MAG TPA: hypothetical protein VNJ28_01700 [Candidatus Limnocylindrales bacterium]|nr:hypothetical protein [Candidatus Limnocylindrales bacterium]